MSWLSDFLGMKKIRTPGVRKAEDLEMDDYEYGIDAYMKDLMKKSGYEKTIITGQPRKLLGRPYFVG